MTVVVHHSIPSAKLWAISNENGITLAVIRVNRRRHSRFDKIYLHLFKHFRTEMHQASAMRQGSVLSAVLSAQLQGAEFYTIRNVPENLHWLNLSFEEAVEVAKELEG